MTDEPRARGWRLAETAAALALLVWRVLDRPGPELGRDAMAILALYWIFTIYGFRTRLWTHVTAATMVLLGAIYLHGQMAHTLISLGITP